MTNDNNQSVNRRSFLKLATLSSSGFILSIHLNSCSDSSTDNFSPSAWLAIQPDGTIQFFLSKMEMGQGIKTSLAMLITEELCCRLDQISIVNAPISDRYGSMVTAGSSSIMELWLPLRHAGAAAKQMLIESAAKIWETDINDCFAKDGKVVDQKTHQSLEYAKLIQIAKTLTIPSNPALKKPETFELIGRGIPSVDLPNVVQGKVDFGIDVDVANLVFAAIKQAPFGATLKGVVGHKPSHGKLVRLEDAVVIVADSYWRAEKALGELTISWSDTSNSQVSDQSIENEYRQLIETAGDIFVETGQVTAQDNSTKLTGDYQVAHQAHATLEPMNCTVSIDESGCDIWVSTQNPAGVLDTAKSVLQTGVNKWIAKLGFAERIDVHCMPVGGGFGRRLESDFVKQALQIAVAVDQPVKLIWSREEDLQHDYYRPYTMHRVFAEISATQTLNAWRHRIVGPTRGRSAGGASNIPYQVGYLKVECHVAKTGVPIGSWRAIGSAHNVFVAESFFDEIAFSMQRKPEELRRELITDNPRMLKVLELAIEKSSMQLVSKSDSYFGIAIHPGFGSFCAQVAKVKIIDGKLKIEKIYCVVDCGQVVNSDSVRAQIEGGILFGLSAAVKGKITIADGQVEQTNFDDYPLLSIADTPEIDITVLSSNEQPGGIGEVGVPPVAPAVANAIFAATGTRLRRLPFEAFI